MTSQLSDYDAAYRKSTKSPDLFWGDLGRERLKWFREFDQVMDCDLEKGEFKWFIGGKINVSGNLNFNCTMLAKQGGTSGSLAIVDQFQFTMEFTNCVGGAIFFYRCTCIINDVKIWPGRELGIEPKIILRAGERASPHHSWIPPLK